MKQIIFLLVIALFVLFLDSYFLQALLGLLKNKKAKKWLKLILWSFTFLVISSLVLLFNSFIDLEDYAPWLRSLIISLFIIDVSTKLIAFPFLLIDDLRRGVIYLLGIAKPKQIQTGPTIPRSKFLTLTAAGVATLPFMSLSHGILFNAHDYQIRKVKLKLSNLPSYFHGLKLALISDIHSGSFYDKTAVKRGVKMIMNQNPDIIFFTGDLVNERTSEVKDYMMIFSSLKADMGIYSVLGNHDYGDYRKWSSEAAKRKNLIDMHTVHQDLGWDLLLNENRILKGTDGSLAILGIENWGTGRFPKYGKLNEAYKGTQDANVKLLLSHDPSHWDAQVRKEYSDIDAMFAGHTHGFQFGVEYGNVKWSPSQYLYKQWAGLYQNGAQQLYVNRGFGYIGYPGRIGILPEITVFELVRA